MLNKAMGLNKGRTMLRFLDTIDGEQNKLIPVQVRLFAFNWNSLPKNSNYVIIYLP